MARSATSTLFRLARLSADGRAAGKGPAAAAKRQVRRKVYRAEGRATRKIFRGFGR